MSGNGSGCRVRILLVEDNEYDRQTIRKAFGSQFDIDAAIHYSQAMEKLKSDQYDFVLLDLMLPERHGAKIMEDGSLGFQLLKYIRENEPLCPVVVISGMQSVKTALKVLSVGVVDYIVKEELIDQLPVILKKIELIRRGQIESLMLRRTQTHGSERKFIYASEQMAAIDKQITKVAQDDTPVILLGESGTGKEVVAREIHRRSHRTNSPFIDINCGAIPELLLETEFFGHEKGAFTGADKIKNGLFELAHNGTLFLDEIADLSAPLQVKLLRVLQEKTFRRVGGTKNLLADVRIIAATNKDLHIERAEKRFRDDLYYRIAGLVLHIPPLRDRKEDIEALAKYFLLKLSPKRDIVLTERAMQALKTYPWPGNVRELENIIHRLVFHADSDEIDRKDVLAILPTTSQSLQTVVSETLNLRQVETSVIQEAIRRSKTQKEAAKLLGIAESSLRRKLS